MSEFDDLFAFASKEEEIEHEAKMLMFHFLDKIQKVADKKKLNRKELAAKIGTSASYITQLFRGDKLVNMTTLAKFQKELEFKFEISIAGELNEKPEDVEKYLNKLIKAGKGKYMKLIKNESFESSKSMYRKFIPSNNKSLTA